MYGTLGAQIRHYRRLRDMSQEELAQAAGYKTKASINKIEKNLTAVPHNRLIRIASALRVPVDNLVSSGNYTPHNKLDTTEQAIEYAYNKTDNTAQALRQHLVGALQALNMEISNDTTLVPKFNALSSSNQQVVMTLVDSLLAQQKTAINTDSGSPLLMQKATNPQGSLNAKQIRQSSGTNQHIQ